MPEEKMKGVDGHAATVLDAPRRFDLSLLRGHHALKAIEMTLISPYAILLHKSPRPAP
jgi:hypothetical protein